MPANAADETNSGASAARLAETAERTFNDASRRFEQAVSEGIEQIRAQSRAYADTASAQFDDAQRYVVERVKERPVTATLAGVGVGLLIGLLLASRGDRR